MTIPCAGGGRGDHQVDGVDPEYYDEDEGQEDTVLSE